MHAEKLLENDMILLATDSVANYMSEEQMRSVLESVEKTTESLQTAVDELLRIAKSAGSTDDMSVCLVKRIVL